MDCKGWTVLVSKSNVLFFSYCNTWVHAEALHSHTRIQAVKWSFSSKILPNTCSNRHKGGFRWTTDKKKPISSTHQLDIFARLTQTLRRETNKKQPQTFSPWWTQPHSLTTSRAEMINQQFSKIITWGFNSGAHKVRQKSNEESAVKCLVCTYRQAALLCQWERPGQPGRFQ